MFTQAGFTAAKVGKTLVSISGTDAQNVGHPTMGYFSPIKRKGILTPDTTWINIRALCWVNHPETKGQILYDSTYNVWDPQNRHFIETENRTGYQRHEEVLFLRCSFCLRWLNVLEKVTMATQNCECDNATEWCSLKWQFFNDVYFTTTKKKKFKHQKGHFQIHGVWSLSNPLLKKEQSRETKLSKAMYQAATDRLMAHSDWRKAAKPWVRKGEAHAHPVWLFPPSAGFQVGVMWNQQLPCQGGWCPVLPTRQGPQEGRLWLATGWATPWDRGWVWKLSWEAQKGRLPQLVWTRPHIWAVWRLTRCQDRLEGPWLSPYLWHQRHTRKEALLQTTPFSTLISQLNP